MQRPSTRSASPWQPVQSRVLLLHHRPDRTDTELEKLAAGLLANPVPVTLAAKGRGDLPVSQPNAVVVGSGPNGLVAALTLARAGLTVQVVEGARDPGGGCRTAELTLPGFAHDVCSTVHPLAVASPFFGAGTSRPRCRMLTPKVAAAHPLDGGRAAAVSGSVAETAAGLGDDGGVPTAGRAPGARPDRSITALALAPLRSAAQPSRSRSCSSAWKACRPRRYWLADCTHLRAGRCSPA